MQRTLFLTLEYPPQVGGVSFYYKNLFTRLPQNDLCIVDNSQNRLLFKNRLLWPRWLKAIVTALRACRTHKIQKIIVGQILPLGTVALIIHFFLHLPYIVMTHAMDVMLPFHTQSKPRRRFLAKLILKHAANITTVSKFTEKKLTEFGVEVKKIILIPPAPTITPEDLVNTDARSVGEKKFAAPLILSVCRLVQRKGVERVIKVLENLLDDFPNLKYVIIGEGEEKPKLQEMVKRRNLEKNVTFLGYCPKEELAHWYKSCDFFVLPTSEANADVEGYGIVFLEAGSFAKPVIAGLGGGVGEAVIDGETGLLVDSNDEKMLEQAMRKLIDDKAYATLLGQNAQCRIKNEFSWEKRAKQLEIILEK